MDDIELKVTQYIDKSWDLLTRKDWLQSSFDPKLSVDELIVYLPPGENLKEVETKNTKNSKPCKIRLFI